MKRCGGCEDKREAKKMKLPHPSFSKSENVSLYSNATPTQSEGWLRRCHSEISLKCWGVFLFELRGKLAIPGL